LKWTKRTPDEAPLLIPRGPAGEASTALVAKVMSGKGT